MVRCKNILCDTFGPAEELNASGGGAVRDAIYNSYDLYLYICFCALVILLICFVVLYTSMTIFTTCAILRSHRKQKFNFLTEV